MLCSLILFLLGAQKPVLIFLSVSLELIRLEYIFLVRQPKMKIHCCFDVNTPTSIALQSVCDISMSSTQGGSVSCVLGRNVVSDI